MSDLILPYKTRFNPELPIEAIQEWERKQSEKKTIPIKYPNFSEKELYIFPDPVIEINNGIYEINGKSKKVSRNNTVLETLKESGFYNSKKDVTSNYFIFTEGYLADGFEENAKIAFDIIDKDYLLEQIQDGYAFLITQVDYISRFKNPNNKFICNMNRIEQEILCKMLSEDLKKKFRLLTSHESVEKFFNDIDFMAEIRNCSIFNKEIITKFKKDEHGKIIPFESSAVVFGWRKEENFSYLDSYSPLSKGFNCFVCLTEDL